MNRSARRDALQDFVSITRFWAAEKPDATVMTYFEDGRRETDRLTFGELDRRARTFAAVLQAKGLAGQRAMLIFPPGLDYAVGLIACMYAGVVPVPAYPPEPHRLEHTMARLQSIIRDAEAPVVVTSSAILAFAQDVIAKTRNEALGALQWLDLDASGAQTSEDWVTPTLGADSLAFMQYTSGSTSSPKGVMIPHGTLIANLRMAAAAYGCTEDSIIASWLPLYHDMGLVGKLLNSIYLGATAMLMPPYAFLKRPVRWLELISRHRATVTAAPNFAYDLCVRKISQEERAALDLSSLISMINGAEPVRHASVERFLRYFEPAGLRRDTMAPSYGMAEVGLFASCGERSNRPVYHTVDKAQLARHRVVEARPGDADAVTLVSSGRTWLDSSAIIAHPDACRRLSEDQVGEIWLAGPHLAGGYWNRPEQTAQTFDGRLVGSDEGPFLRTGDLGFIRDGELFVTGRRKDLLIIRGRNLYPQDIELSMDGTRAALPEVRPGCSVAISADFDGREQLVVIQEVDPRRNPGFDARQTISTLRDAVTRDHEVQVRTVVLLGKGSLPKTSSGKVMRQACKKAFLADFAKGGLEVLARDDLAGSASPTNWAALAASVTPDAGEIAASASRADRVIEWLQAYAPRQLDPQQIDDRRTMPPSVILDFGAQGLLGLQVPRALGGLSLTLADMGRVLQQVAAIDLTLAAFLEVHNALGVAPILRAGSDALRAEVLPSLARGQALATMGFTEASGAHPAALRSSALPAGQGWQLNGEKAWVPGAAWSAYLNVFVEQDDAITGFVVGRHAAGVHLGPEVRMLGVHGICHHGVRLEGVVVDADAVLGAPGRGLEVAAGAQRVRRFLIAHSAVGAMKRALQLRVRYASRRNTNAGWLLDDPQVLWAINRASQEIRSLEGLLERIAAVVDGGGAVPPEVIDATKVIAAEALWQQADGLVQTLGARGYVEANQAAKMLRDARRLRLVAGSSEVLTAQVGAAALESEALVAFVEEGLNAPETAARLRQATATMKIGKDARAAGLLVGLCLGLGALEGDPEARSPTVSRARAAFEARVAALLATLAEKQPRPPTARSMASVVQAYARSIGDLDPWNAEQERSMGPLLQAGTTRPAPARARRAPPHPTPPRAAPKAPAPVPRKADPVGQLKAWMIGWIAKELGMDPRTLTEQMGFSPSSQTPFSALGIDSVTAIQFVSALEEKLDCSIPHSALWDHDTVDSLARFLLAHKQQAG